MKLSTKDKKMLIVLGAFLLLLGYYEFVINPLYRISKKSNNSLITEKKDLLILKTKVASLSNYNKKFANLANIVKIAEKSIIMPFVNVALDSKIKAIMGAAEKSHVKIRSIKPMNSIQETKDGKTKVIKDKYFSIEGAASIDNLLMFLRNLWGTKLDSINISSMNEVGSELRYFIKIEFLSKIEFKFDNSNDTVTAYKDFKLKYNPFTVIKPPPPPKPKYVKPIKTEPPKIVHKLDNFTLIGIAQFNKDRMAIIDDKLKKRVMYLLKGDSFRESIVKSISDKIVSFYFADNKQVITVKLKENALKLKAGTPKKSNDKNKKKGHLGIMVETFTQDLANRYKLEFNPGLFVISPGRHRNVFKKNDIIIEINEQAVPNFEAALRIMNKVYAGDKIKIVLKRDGKVMNFSYNAD
jgi:hypothetical protein